MATEAEIKAAELKMNNAYAAIAPARASMDSWCNLVSTRNYTEGTNRTTCSQKVSVVCGEQIDALCCKSTKYSEDTCEKDKSSYNSSVINWEAANENYENAKEEYDNIKDQKGEEDVTKIEQDASGIRTRYYVFGGIVVVLIIVAVFVIMKLKK